MKKPKKKSSAFKGFLGVLIFVGLTAIAAGLSIQVWNSKLDIGGQIGLQGLITFCWGFVMALMHSDEKEKEEKQ